MKNLPFPDNQHLEAAEGWLGLGSWRDAAEELEKISPKLRNHPFVLEVRYKIFSEAKDWDQAVGVAQEIQKSMPDNAWGHFYTAYALHELKRTEEAYATLSAVADQYPDEWLMRYNLACYASQMGKPALARKWFKRAIDLTEKRDVCALGMADRDLQPLWLWIAALAEL